MKPGHLCRAGLHVVAILLLASVCSCGVEEGPLGATTEIGVFYGGQVQRAQKVVVSSLRPPKLGFRVIFAPKKEGAVDQESEHQVHYELTRPGPAGRRVTTQNDLIASSEHEHLDHVFKFEGAPRLGVWNIRVTFGGRILGDRALYLVAPR